MGIVLAWHRLAECPRLSHHFVFATSGPCGSPRLSQMLDPSFRE